MRAEIFKIEENIVKAITSDDKIINIPKDKIDFEYSIGDFIVVEKENNKEYYSPLKSAEKSGKKDSKKPHKARIITIVIIILLLIASAIAAAIIIPKKIEERRVAQLNNQLNRCLYDGYKQLNPNDDKSFDDLDFIKSQIFSEANAPYTKAIGNITISAGSVSEAELQNKQYDMAISCYNNYQVEGFQEKINELNSYKNGAEQAICVFNAEKNSSISDEELESARYDTIKTIALLTRLSNGYQEQINCYEKYNGKDATSEISELKSKKSETDAYIESAKNSNVGGRTGLYCTTNTIGNYTYTNCY